MKIIFYTILGVVVLFSSHLISQDAAASDKIPASLATTALQHIEKLANIGCREAGSPKEALALAYIEVEFKKMGLLTRREDFNFFSYSPEEIKLQIGSEQLTPEYVCFDPYSPAKTISGPAACVAPQLPQEEMFKLDLTDKIIITTRPANDFLLARKKPKAIVFLKADDLARCQKIASPTAELQTSGKVVKLKSANLVSTIPASAQLIRRILVSAHYDSAGGPGAADNASGVALLLEIARYFRNKQMPSGVQLEFAALGAEEIGMLGSKAFLVRHGETLGQYELVFNIDTVGGNEDIRIDMLAGVEDVSSRKGISQIPAELADKAEHDGSKRWGWLKPEVTTLMASCVPAWLQEKINAAAAELGCAFKPSRYMGSDHLIFAQAGIPATDIATAGSVTHIPGDTADKINLPNLEKVAALVIRVIEKTIASQATKNGERLSNIREIPYKEEIAPYVTFLKKQSQKPVDYVMGLFEKYDMVILCERHHAENTQYNFIYDLVSDKRFIEKVGNIFTEVGASTTNDYLHDFLFASGLSDKEVENRLLYIYRNFDRSGIWEKHNLYDFLKRLYTLNKSLSANLKVNLYFSDMPFSWQGMTQEKYQQFWSGIEKRDWVMADQIIKKFADIAKSTQPRKKALVIMNYRHAFNDFKYADGTKADNTGRYIFEALPGKVANVMLNSLTSFENSTDNKETYSPVSNGKWDAAFEVVGNPSVGFDFIGNSYGADYFDYFTFQKHNLTYQDVFTGFIFHKPLKEHKYLWGTQKLLADGYDKIILDRLAIAGYPVAADKVNEFIKESETLKEITIEEEYTTKHHIQLNFWKISQWLLPAKK